MTGECTLEFGQGGLARLAGALTFETCTDLYQALQKNLAEGRNPERIDLAGITEVDSAGLALLLEWQSASQAAGTTLSVCGAPDGLVHLARLCDAVELLHLSGRDE